MATIRASCPDCGDVEFTTADVTVRVSAEDGSGTYAFRCPGCRVKVIKSAEPRTIDLLLASGVDKEDGPVIAESAMPSGHQSDADPVTHDDLLDFHDLLETDDWFDRLSGDNEA